MKINNSIYFPNIQYFRILVSFRALLENKLPKLFYGPSTTHEDDHFATTKIALKLDEKIRFKFWNLAFVPSWISLFPKP